MSADFTALDRIDAMLDRCRDRGNVRLSHLEAARNALADLTGKHDAATAELGQLRAEAAEPRARCHLCRTSLGIAVCTDCAEDLAGEGKRIAERNAAGQQSELPVARGLRADKELHACRAHLAYEYATTEGPRKAFDRIDEPPEGDGWERNVDAGRPGEGWERFDYHEESYWRRLRASVPQQPAHGEGDGHV